MLDLAQLSASQKSASAALSISTCSQEVTVPYNIELHNIVVSALSTKEGGSFDRWIHPQLIYGVDESEYNNL